MTQLFSISKTILNHFSIKHSSPYLETIIRLSSRESSPLLAIQKVLETYDIQTLLVKFSVSDLREAPFPCIVPLGKKAQSIHIVNGIGETIDCVDSKGKHFKPTEEQFIEEWNGVALLLEVTEHSREPNYERNKIVERNLGARKSTLFSVSLLLAGLFIFSFFLSSSINALSFTFLLLAKFAGIYTCFLLKREELGDPTEISSRICSLASKNNCNQVTNSSASKLLGISLTDLGMLYFICTAFTLTLSTLSSNAVHYISVLKAVNWICIGFSFFSLYYQGKVLKTWCPLCLSVLVVFLFELVLLWTFQLIPPYRIVLELADLLIVGFGFILPVILLVTIMPFVRDSVKATFFEDKYSSLKNNEEILKLVLENGRDVSSFPNQAIELSNEKATEQLLIVVSTSCQPCRYAYRELKGLISHFGEALSVKFLPISFNPQNDIHTRAALTLQALLGATSDSVQKFKLIDSLFDLNEESIEDWLSEHYLPNIDSNSYGEVINWTKGNQITYTPFLVLNRKAVINELKMGEIKTYLKKRRL